MSDQQLSVRGAAFIKAWEGCKLIAYRCSAGVWTIGWGHTGPNITKSTRWSQREANEQFDRDIEEREAVVRKYVHVPLTQNQFDALVSFVFNVGVENFRISSLLRLLNLGDYDGAMRQFKRWNKVFDPTTHRHKADPGLTQRRTAEAALFNDTN